jgi:hypothetical protein
MGSGEIGSNGSVHWRISYNEQGVADHVDYDTKPYDQIGKGKPNGDHPGHIRVTARFKTANAASAALAGAQKGNTLVIDIPVRPFNEVQNGPGNPNDWEVRVDW